MSDAARNAKRLDMEGAHPCHEDRFEQNTFEKILKAMTDMTTVSSLMRLLGAMSLIAGMSVFLLQGWGESSDSSRFLMILTQTLLMSIVGFGLHFFLKENKGARVFFGLSLLSVTANFAVLGALIYSVVQFDQSLQGLPDFATWVMTDVGSLVLCVLAGALVLVPVSFFGFRLFARGNTKRFATVYLLICSLMLLPIREPAYIVVLVFAVVIFISKLLENIEGVNTVERNFATGILFVPLAIMGFRSLYFYQVELITLCLILGFVYYGIRKLTYQLRPDSRLKIISNLLSLPLSIWMAISLLKLLFGYIDNASWCVLFAVLAFSALMIDLVFRSQEKTYSRMFSIAGSAALALCFTFILSVDESVLMTLFVIAIGVAWGLTGYLLRSRIMMGSGVLVSGAVLVTEFVDLITAIDLNNWLILSVLGGSIIVIASVSERYGVTIKLKFEKLFLDFRESKTDLTESGRSH